MTHALLRLPQFELSTGRSRQSRLLLLQQAGLLDRATVVEMAELTAWCICLGLDGGLTLVCWLLINVAGICATNMHARFYDHVVVPSDKL